MVALGVSKRVSGRIFVTLATVIFFLFCLPEDSFILTLIPLIPGGIATGTVSKAPNAIAASFSMAIWFSFIYAGILLITNFEEHLVRAQLAKMTWRTRFITYFSLFPILAIQFSPSIARGGIASERFARVISFGPSAIIFIIALFLLFSAVIFLILVDLKFKLKGKYEGK